MRIPTRRSIYRQTPNLSPRRERAAPRFVSLVHLSSVFPRVCPLWGERPATFIPEDFCGFITSGCRGWKLGLGGLGLGVRVSKIGIISKFLQIFGGLVLGCIKTKFCKKICVRQHFSGSTRFASFCTAAISKFSQNIGLKNQQVS